MHQVALSNFAGTADFTIDHGSLQESGLKENTNNNLDDVKTSVVTVKVDKLDNYTSEMQDLSFISIDCEGTDMTSKLAPADA